MELDETATSTTKTLQSGGDNAVALHPSSGSYLKRFHFYACHHFYQRGKKGNGGKGEHRWRVGLESGPGGRARCWWRWYDAAVDETVEHLHSGGDNSANWFGFRFIAPARFAVSLLRIYYLVPWMGPHITSRCNKLLSVPAATSSCNLSSRIGFYYLSVLFASFFFSSSFPIFSSLPLFF